MVVWPRWPLTLTLTLSLSLSLSLSLTFLSRRLASESELTERANETRGAHTTYLANFTIANPCTNEGVHFETLTELLPRLLGKAQHLQTRLLASSTVSTLRLSVLFFLVFLVEKPALLEASFVGAVA